MKKNYFFLAAAATLFAACAETDVLVDLSEKENAPKAIGFETFADNITRAVSEPLKLESYHDAFGVWAYKTVSATKTSVMNNYKVEKPTSSSTAWSYASVANQSLKYWDKNASYYSFYAYAPYVASASNVAESVVTESAGKIIIKAGEYAANENLQTWGTSPNTAKFSGVGATSTSASTDWMIATEIPTYTEYTDAVSENFAHTMSKLIVILKSSEVSTDTEVEVTSVSVNNVYGSGSFDGDKWTATGTTKSISGAVGKFADISNHYSMEYLLIPSATAPTFSITYTVNGDRNTVTNAEIPGITKFEANTCYTLTATIGLAPIEFSATATDFTPAAGTGTGTGSVTIE